MKIRWSRLAETHSPILIFIITLQTKCPAGVAKEVGMGNPAEIAEINLDLSR